MDGNLEHLTGDDLLELFGEHAAAIVGLIAVHDEAERVDRLAGKQDIEFDQVRRLVPVEIVIKAGVAFGVGLELVEVVHDELGQRDLPQHLHRMLR